MNSAYEDAALRVLTLLSWHEHFKAVVIKDCEEKQISFDRINEAICMVQRNPGILIRTGEKRCVIQIKDIKKWEHSDVFFCPCCGDKHYLPITSNREIWWEEVGKFQNKEKQW